MDNANPAHRYAHRAKPFSNDLELALSDRELVAERGRSKQTYTLARLERIRLTFKPRNTARKAFVCEVRAEDGKSVKFDNISWKSLIDVEHNSAGYRAFVLELVRLAAAANPKLELLAGLAPWRYRLMQIVGYAFVAALGGAAIMAGLHSSPVVALACLGLGAYLAFWLHEFLTRNTPRVFRPDAVPEAVLPQLPV